MMHSTPFSPPTSVSKSSRSTCATCSKPITTKSVKALDKRYHTECFGCADCGVPILSKYFPFETEDGSKIPLCEEHFYKRRGLVCCTCHSYLKGTHYTVFGRKYDAEHFCCKICSKKFGTDEDFFNHENDIYCHYHFSKFFIDRCEGCEFAILKQYVEISRGGRNQKWHVECYMIHKCWNTAITPNTIGLSYFPKVEPTKENIKNLPDTNPSPEQLISMESKASDKIAEVWATLFKFEEDAAMCISDMLQFATAHDQRRGLTATAKLVLKVDSLFKSIESLHRLGIEVEDTSMFNLSISNNEDVTFHMLKKEPRNFSAKIMIYLTILRKTSKGATDTNKSQDLILSVVTGLAHYLKLLIRYGLHNSLQYNKSSHTTNALDKFLREVRNHESVPSDALSALDIPVDASDLCFHCQRSIESDCVQYQDKRWHFDCLQCTNCRKNLHAFGGIADASFNSKRNWVLCAQCAMDDPDAKPGFKSISKLLQLSYLMKIAIVRSKAVMDYEIQNQPQAPASENNDGAANELHYRKTLNEIKRLRSTRQNTTITESVSKETARKSVIVETTNQSGDELAKGDAREVSEENLLKQRSSEDEKVGPSLSKNSFHRAKNVIMNQKVLTLDDIPRIVAAEHARELRPNTYKYHNPLQDEGLFKGLRPKSGSLLRNPEQAPASGNAPTMKEVPAKYYSQLNHDERFFLSHISASVLNRLIGKQGLDIDAQKLIDLKKAPSFWDKLKGLGIEKKNVGVNNVFGAELKLLTAKTGVESSQSNGPSKVRIPLLIDELLTALYQKDMSVEGVFRKNGNLKTLRELCETIDANPSSVPDLAKENAIQLSALLKKFLREMPNPLLTFKLFDLWILSQKVKDPAEKRTFFELSYSLLPRAHRDLAEVLFFFFLWSSSFSHLDEQNGSKMDVHNLATVLSPNVLYAKPSEVARPAQTGKAVAATYYDAFGENEGENYYLAIEVVDYLIAHNEELSIVPNYLTEIYDLCGFNPETDTTSKDVFAKIDSVLKGQPSVLDSVGRERAGTHTDENSAIMEESSQPVTTTIEN